ncbi:hypothetical protein [Acetatifactor muris]|uniref:hypothetical protein n=1 Tax=Acetatifactor muris TaxID=879566 RepID=UPI0023F2C7DC|nr:hypothetical protein [Acetatifactor muris]
MLSKAQILKARKAVEKLYTGTCRVTEHQKVKDSISKLTAYTDLVVLDNQPCRLIFKSADTAGQNETAVSVEQTVKLLISPDIVIRPGSKITVTQNGATADYTYSGVPAVYLTHQEITLQLFERWA